ncbi:hypothetical protein RRSWK_00063 [Rhodopirellula sp. SWK7]|nr:hypothetical protein RRSWK_00063 [Rhodopirellula sp. SWK7]
MSSALLIASHSSMRAVWMIWGDRSPITINAAPSPPDHTRLIYCD